jgi:hypothetical protein
MLFNSVADQQPMWFACPLLLVASDDDSPKLPAEPAAKACHVVDVACYKVFPFLIPFE